MMEREEEIKAMFFGSNEEPRDEEDTLSATGSEELGEKESQTEEVEREEGEDSDTGDGEKEGESSDTAAEEEETLEDRYARLLQDLNSANARLLEIESGAQPAMVPQPVPVVTQTTGTVPMVPVETPEFVLDKGLVEKALVEGDSEAFSQILSAVVTHTANMLEAQKVATLRTVPELATQMALQKVEQQNAVNAFYAENPELVPHRATVGMIANRIVSQNPQFSLKEIFESTEKEARKMLGLKKKILDSQTTEAKKNFAKKAGSRKPGKQVLTGLRGEIAEMNAARR